MKLSEVLFDIDELQIITAINLIQSCSSSGGTVWLVGNGGSAALAAHMAVDLQLAGIRALALTDVCAVTSYGNDNGFGQVFHEQLRSLAKQGDVVILISGSGTSGNLTMITDLPRSASVTTIGIFGEGYAQADVDLLITIPTKWMPHAQDGHQVVLHIISYWLMSQREKE